MMLGEFLTAARKSGNGIKDWLALAEPEIWTALGEAAEAEGMDHAAYARIHPITGSVPAKTFADAAT
ncbi:MAG: hypothetical protein WBV62_03225 [Roseobacter sp.]